MIEALLNSELRAMANGAALNDLEIRSDVGNMVPLPTNVGKVTIDVEAPEPYAGRHRINTNQLDRRPGRLMEPKIAYDADACALYLLVPGLWAYDENIDAPVLRYRWRKDGKNLRKGSSTTYVLQPEDYGRSITLREIADDANGRLTSTSEAIIVPVQGDAFEVLLEEDGRLRIDGNDGRDFSVDPSSESYAGTYSVVPGTLGTGPVSLVPPVLSFPPNIAPGDALTITPPLFAYDPDLGDPVVSYSAGVDASDPTNPVYTVQSGDQGQTITIVATATQGSVSVDTVSNAVEVASPPIVDLFEVVLEEDGKLRIDGNDGRDFSIDPSSESYAGTYSVAPAVLGAGPVPLVPPVLSFAGDVAAGDVLTITPALIAYDPDLGDLIVSYSAGVDAGDPTNPVYTVQSGDQGQTITIVATATQGSVSADTVSNAVEVASPPVVDLFEVVREVDGTLRIDGNDGRDFTVDPASNRYSGTYGVAPGALGLGPIALVPPALSVPAGAAVGDTVVITPALFAYDPDLGDPAVRYSAGVDASDPDVPVYVIQPGDLGNSLSVTATAAQGASETASTSNGVVLA